MHKTKKQQQDAEVEAAEVVEEEEEEEDEDIVQQYCMQKIKLFPLQYRRSFKSSLTLLLLLCFFFLYKDCLPLIGKG